jgi:hypothetical protein
VMSLVAAMSLLTAVMASSNALWEEINALPGTCIVRTSIPYSSPEATYCGFQSREHSLISGGVSRFAVEGGMSSRRHSQKTNEV